jgi:hypothetical protein
MKRKLSVLSWIAALLAITAALSGGCGGGNDSPAPAADEVDIYSLSGTWVARDGNGTAGSYQLKLQKGGSIIEFLNYSANDATAKITYDFFWDVYNAGQFVDTYVLGVEGQQILIERKGKNRFRYTDPDGSTIDITITAPSEAYVDENGTINGARYHATYYMDK